MKKFKTMFIINQCAYWSIYLIKSFIIWELNNPFQWIIDIPTYSESDRFQILFSILMVIGIETFIAKEGMNEDGTFAKTT